MVLYINILNQYGILYAQDNGTKSYSKEPTVRDRGLRLEKVMAGLSFPTGMAFLGPDDVLIIEKNDGTVQRITNGNELPEALLHVDVNDEQERGMLGIAVAVNQTNNPNPYIFLYFTKSEANEDNARNHLYRYELVNDSKLQNPKLLLSTPSTDRSFHQGGKLVIGPDHNIYAIIGDHTKYKATQAQNIRNGSFPDITSSIVRISLDGQVPSNDLLGEIYPLNLYYAYGIRNSFGIDFDPITGKLWDTEDGPEFGDEINLVEPGFNSGWSRVQGIWSPVKIGNNSDHSIGNMVLNPDDLVDFDGKGKYSRPEFTWKIPACVSAIKFLHSDKYGNEYKDDAFVGTSVGDLYHFDMNKNRNGFILNSSLSDKIADSNSRDELNQVLFGFDFGGGITDMQIGPYDGLLYIVTGNGAIYKMVPK